MKPEEPDFKNVLNFSVQLNVRRKRPELVPVHGVIYLKYTKKNKCKLYTFKTLTYLQSAEPQR